MDLEELKSQYDKLLKDEDFDKLDLGMKNPNIFQILRIIKMKLDILIFFLVIRPQSITQTWRHISKKIFKRGFFIR